MDIVVLASHLARIGYEVVLRTAIGGGVGQQCFRNLSNEFLVVSAPFGSEAKDIIIDLKFRHAVCSITMSFPNRKAFCPKKRVGTGSMHLQLAGDLQA